QQAHSRRVRAARPLEAGPLCRPIAETQASALARGVGCRQQPPLIGVGLHGEWTTGRTGEEPALRAVEELAHPLRRVRGLGAALSGEVERGDLLGREPDLRQVVALLPDDVPLLDVPG